MVKIIEDGLYAHDQAAGGPLAEAALRRAGEAGRRMERLQQDPDALTDAQLRDEVRRALRHFMQREPHIGQVASLAGQIRRGTRCAWLVSDRLALMVLRHMCGYPPEKVSDLLGLPLAAVLSAERHACRFLADTIEPPATEGPTP